MSDFYRDSINGHLPESAGTSDYWDMVRELNPEVYKLVKQEVQKQNVVFRTGDLFK